MDIRLALRIVTHYAALLVLFVTPYLILRQFVDHFAVDLAYVIAIVLLFQKVHKLLEPYTDRIFAGALAYQKDIKAITRSTLEILSEPELVVTITKTLRTAMNLSSARMVKFSGGDLDPIGEALVAGKEEINLEDLKQASGSRIQDRIHPNPDTPIPPNRALIEALTALDVELALPVMINDEVRAGIYLGTKKNNELFFDHDYQLLRDLCDSVALALRRIEHQETLLREQKAMANAQLAAVVNDFIHDTRNKLQPMLVAPEHVMRSLDQVEAVKQNSGVYSVVKTALDMVGKYSASIAQSFDNIRSYLNRLEERNLPFNLNDAFRRVLAGLRRDFPAVPLTADLPAFMSVYGQAQRLELALGILLRFRLARLTPPQAGLLTATVDERTQVLRFELADNGPTYTEQELKELLDIYTTGFNIELILARKIFQRHNGNILIRNGEAGGSLIRFHFDVTNKDEII